LFVRFLSVVADKGDGGGAELRRERPIGNRAPGCDVIIPEVMEKWRRKGGDALSPSLTEIIYFQKK